MRSCPGKNDHDFGEPFSGLTGILLKMSGKTETFAAKILGQVNSSYRA